MKKTFRIIFEYIIGLKLLLVNPKGIKDIDYDFSKRWFKSAKKELKTKFLRNIIAHLFKKHRPPYEVKDFEKIRNLYLEYEQNKPLQSIYQVNMGDYVKIIDSKFPIKGERFNDYYMGEHWFSEKHRVFKVAYIDIKQNTICSDRNEFARDIRQCRFATQEEIENFILSEIEDEIKEAIKFFPKRFNSYKR